MTQAKVAQWLHLRDHLKACINTAPENSDSNWYLKDTQQKVCTILVLQMAQLSDSSGTAYSERRDDESGGSPQVFIGIIVL